MGPLHVLAGEERLAVVFWLYLLAGGALVILVPHVGAEVLHERGVATWVFVAYAIVEALYLLWVHVSLWTCAYNTRHRVLGHASRSYVILAAIAVMYVLLVPTHNQVPKPQIFMEMSSSSP